MRGLHVKKGTFKSHLHYSLDISPRFFYPILHELKKFLTTKKGYKNIKIEKYMTV